MVSKPYRPQDSWNLTYEMWGVGGGTHNQLVRSNVTDVTMASQKIDLLAIRASGKASWRKGHPR